MPFIPRLFFEVSRCRFCGLHAEPGHIESCVVLYQRACRAIRALGSALGDMDGVTVQTFWDLIIQFRYRLKTCWLVVE